MADKNFTEIISELKNITNKLNENGTSMEEAIELFKTGSELIKCAKTDLEKIEGEVKKVIDEVNVEDFK